MLWWLCSEALEPLLPGAQKIFSNTVKQEMLPTPNLLQV